MLYLILTINFLWKEIFLGKEIGSKSNYEVKNVKTVCLIGLILLFARISLLGHLSGFTGYFLF